MRKLAFLSIAVAAMGLALASCNDAPTVIYVPADNGGGTGGNGGSTEEMVVTQAEIPVVTLERTLVVTQVETLAETLAEIPVETPNKTKQFLSSLKMSHHLVTLVKTTKLILKVLQ